MAHNFTTVRPKWMYFGAYNDMSKPSYDNNKANSVFLDLHTNYAHCVSFTMNRTKSSSNMFPGQ